VNSESMAFCPPLISAGCTSLLQKPKPNLVEMCSVGRGEECVEYFRTLSLLPVVSTIDSEDRGNAGEVPLWR